MKKESKHSIRHEESIKKFIEKYLETLNAYQSYRYAFPDAKENSARTLGVRLLSRVHVKKEIDRRIAERAEKAKISQEKVLLELAKIAFANPKDIFTKSGGLIDVANLENDVASAVASIQIDSNNVGRHKVTTKKIRFHDKIRALQLVGRHIGMFKDEDGAGAVEKLAAALKSVAGGLPD